MSEGALLSVRDLRTYFDEEGRTARAVDGVSFDLARGETLGIVGESGSGKSVTNLSIMRLVPTPPGRIAGGEIIFDGRDLLKLSDAEMRAVRGKRIGMIFQDPMTSLNPFMRISRQLMEVTELHLGHGRTEARQHAIRMLEMVGIPDPVRRVDGYPHEFSGGMRQRVMIAMALSCHPELIIADEPTTALDVTIQTQILNIIREQQRAMRMAVIFITHDMGVVAEMGDEVVVMKAGEKVEAGPVRQIFHAPAHPYTRSLLGAVPRLGSMRGHALPLRPGSGRSQDTVDRSTALLDVQDLSVRFDVKTNALGRATHRI